MPPLTLVLCAHKIENFIEFEDRLDNSLNRDVIKLEHVRMRMTFEPIMVGDLVDMEALELKFIFDRRMTQPLSVYLITEICGTVHHDNRDVDVLPSYQPRTRPSFYSQTTLFEKDTEVRLSHMRQGVWTEAQCSWAG